MRILPSDEHQSRKEKILQAVIHLFIHTGKPVGSSTIVENYKVNLSSATIRNVLAELEREGFLTHPHTSAGRMPTDKGYRFYVDSIVNIQRLAAEEERRIQMEYVQRRRELEDLMLSTTRLLSGLSHCAGFVLPPKRDVDKLRRIELIPVSNTRLLVVLVSDTGFVRNQMLDVNDMPLEDTLRSASRYLNEQLSGLSFSEAQSRLLSELDRFHEQQRLQEDLLGQIGRGLFDASARNEVYVEGASNMLKLPDFQDFEALRNFAQLVDEKEALSQALSKGLDPEGVQVRIGSENFPELKDFSVVSSGFMVRGRPVGVLGILGPRRMPYERMIAIVNTVAKLMNKFLDEHSYLLKEEPHER